MKENLIKVKDTVHSQWTNRTKNQKGILIGSVVLIIALIIGLSLFVFNTKYSPLYNNLSLQEVSQIKEELDARGVSYEITEGGTAIAVPKDKVDTLLVDLSGQGIPKSGGIDFSYFSENASWGITDSEFDIMKLDAMNTELANLMKGIDGIDDANVMINLPEESVFVNETSEEASASIILHTGAGYQISNNQIESLYHLVSKAIPNLPTENISIMNQHFEVFDEKQGNTYEDEFTYQQTVKNDIERDIQRRLQQMLGRMIGTDKVIVSVTADIDFTKENRVEELIEPVDLENMEGLPVNIETIQETFSGDAETGGVVGSGDEDIPNYPAADSDGEGEYELVKEAINNEFNRIHKDIVESPYKVRDLGVQVAVDNMKDKDDDQVEYLSQEDENSVEAGITSILNSIVSTSIDKEYGEINAEEKVSIVFQEFADDSTPKSQTPTMSIPAWLYITGATLIGIIIILAILLMRRPKQTEEEDFVQTAHEGIQLEEEIPDIDTGPETEATMRRKQLEKMASDKPEDFAKLLRSWITDD